jgi:hypothetical protein
LNKNLSQHFYNTLPDAEVIEVELVWRFRNCEGEELFSVLVDVRRPRDRKNRRIDFA